MDAKQNQTKKSSEAETSDVATSDVSTNPELGIKRVRTFEDDLREAKEKAGVKDEPVPQKKGFFGKRKKIAKEKSVKTLSSRIQPEVQPEVLLEDEDKQPSREYVEQELARSGIITDEDDHSLKEENKTSIPVIRTYKYDAAESVQEGHVSQVSMAAAEQNRRAKEKDFSSLLPSEDTPIGKNILYILLSILLVATGVWGGVHFYNKSRIVADEAITPNKGVLLFTNSEERLVIGKLKGVELATLLNEERSRMPNNPSTIKQVTLLEDGVFGEREISADLFMARFINVPGRLSRALSNNFLFGIHGGNPPSPLFIFKTKDFDTTFRGMLDWEATMSRDLSPLFGKTISGNFEDVILRNKDTRLLRDKGDKTRLIYGFPNTDTLIITTNEDTFFEIFKRLSASNATRN